MIPYSHLLVFFLAPLHLTGEGIYSLSAVKQVKATEAFLSYDEETRQCQNKEKVQDCWSRNFLQAAQDICGCMPFQIREVLGFRCNIFLYSNSKTLFLVSIKQNK